MTSSPPSALRAWAASGAMALTGRRDGPPRCAPGAPAQAVAENLQHIAERTSDRTGVAPPLPGVQILSERAAIAGLSRNGPTSVGGAFRMMRTADGWLGLSLSRADDVDMVPALTQADARAGDPWVAVAAWAASLPTDVAAGRVELLGLAGSAVPQRLSPRRGVAVARHGRRAHLRERPRIIDLTALWAGPLCAHLLGLGGAEVIKVESAHRPDGARGGPPEFFDLLHAGHAMVGLDFRDPRDIAALRELISTADLVLESSRARALRQLGIDADEHVAAGTSWLSITARGRDSNAVGFGDDVAAAAGLVVADGPDLLPCGDALADPLAGVAAAAAASDAMLDDHARLIDVSMLHVAAETTVTTPEEHAVVEANGRWWVETASGRFPVADPVARRPAGQANR